jgi:NADH-quinone oxidoreductase subunit H
MGLYGLILTLLLNIILMLLVTLVIASLTLIERKFLSLLQRRVGPNYVGYKGRLQYIADALKLFVKGVLIPYESNKFWFVLIPSTALSICYSFWINSVWGPSLSIFDIEYNTVYASLLSIIFSFCIILTGFFSRNKYAMLASIRTVLLVLNLEIFLGLLILNLVLLTESFSFTSFVLLQENIWFIFLYFGLAGVITITFLLEVNRAPFDLAEAESELITGYSTELGGFHFGLYYLGEYFHLFFFSMTVVIFFLGGWELPNLLLFVTPNFLIF